MQNGCLGDALTTVDVEFLPRQDGEKDICKDKFIPENT